MAVTGAAARVQVQGQLVEHREGFEVELRRLGFTPVSIVNQFYLLAHFSHWLQDEGIVLADLSVGQVDAFLVERKATHTALFTRRALRTLLRWLALSGSIPAEAAEAAALPEDPVVLVRFERYLLRERRIGARTTSAYVVRIRRFLAAYVPPDGFTALGGAEVTRALLDEGVGRAPASVKKFGYALRSFLRFCFVTGELDRDLTGATLVIRNPLPSLLPVGASAAEIAILLNSCDRSTAAGRREYAIIMLLSRLGLRAGEVAGMQLDDIRWHVGEVLIRGKGAKDEYLPLPAEVGAAVVDYLMHARSADASVREVFCGLRAPRNRLGSPAIWVIVTRACTRAHLEPFGPHQLRHGLAEAMVAAEVPLAGIGQVLRHEDPATTANYARVDVVRLRQLAQPWPAGGELA
ncbi:tyrosine-type recombinase/integrase [Cryobacterium sp. SO1]|uniref:tyrosine-type recombinase/integrase n=1 Tax=Cryobacterium sp. SO1 TaxID=1897061 RepID=UPI001022F0B4|nr:tyrosine-type recombinase/integrase [Cryobacterium sp. SO1]RZI35030.1 Tyrosine recombinase XerD [Cryobacterium sp. SO1]